VHASSSLMKRRAGGALLLALGACVVVTMITTPEHASPNNYAEYAHEAQWGVAQTHRMGSAQMTPAAKMQAAVMAQRRSLMMQQRQQHPVIQMPPRSPDSVDPELVAALEFAKDAAGAFKHYEQGLRHSARSVRKRSALGYDALLQSAMPSQSASTTRQITLARLHAQRLRLLALQRRKSQMEAIQRAKAQNHNIAMMQIHALKLRKEHLAAVRAMRRARARMARRAEQEQLIQQVKMRAAKAERAHKMALKVQAFKLKEIKMKKIRKRLALKTKYRSLRAQFLAHVAVFKKRHQETLNLRTELLAMRTREQAVVQTAHIHTQLVARKLRASQRRKRAALVRMLHAKKALSVVAKRVHHSRPLE